MRCIHCGQEIEYHMPAEPPGLFMGGWVADDGWGITCTPPHHVHEPMPPDQKGEGWSISVLGDTDRIIG